MINGLQLTIPGEEVRRLLEQRLEDHRQRADWWKREQARTPKEQTEDTPLLAEHICENEAERHEWRAAALEFIRDRIESAEVYRLGEADLRFGELLPEKPGCWSRRNTKNAPAWNSIWNEESRRGIAERVGDCRARC